mmetsp:Transcript_4655/g.8205  ORF Transcript_4655/g.8205 Transcript_4655/m.8205 type:complete len:1038 (+) Transcript_4655:156-3269(+)
MRGTTWAAAVLCGHALTHNAGARGALAEWDDKHRISPSVLEATEGRTKLYGRYANSAYWFRVEPVVGAEVYESTVYFNTDQDTATVGHENNTETPEGYEMYAFVTGTSVELYKGCGPYNGDECREILQVLSEDTKDFAMLEDGSVEFKIAGKTFGKKAKDIDIAVVLQSRKGVEEPILEIAPMYLLNYFTLYKDLDKQLATKCKGKGEYKVAVVYDEASRDAFYQDLSYAQLLLAMQNQARMAGLPLDVIPSSQLYKLSKMCEYSAILMPELNTVDPKKYHALRKSLHMLVHVHGVGLVVSGEMLTMMTNGELSPGDPYFTLKQLLGVSNYKVVATGSLNTIVRVNSLPEMFWDRTLGEIVMDNQTTGSMARMFEPIEGRAFTSHTAATQTLDVLGEESVLPAVMLHEMDSNMYGKTPGRLVHFSSEQILGNADLGWRALVWIVRGSKPVHVALQMTRFDGGIFTTRNDVDQSKMLNQSKILEEGVLEQAYEPWYTEYNFVASNYINIGNSSLEGVGTDWPWAKVLYQKYIELEHEMGSHSYTHPFRINDLSNEMLKYEFNDAKRIIKTKLKLDRIASAQPGNPNNLRVGEYMDRFHPATYFSGGFSGPGAGFPGAFGFLRPDSKMVYVAPNVEFDFSLQILGKTPSEIEATWRSTIGRLDKFSSAQVYHWPIHDYAILDFNFTTLEIGTQGHYELEIFTNTIEYAHNLGMEFITTMQLADRIRTFDTASVQVSEVGPNIMRAKVGIMKTVPVTHTLGYNSLALAANADLAHVVSVTDYYAYNNRKVFLPANGGVFDIQYGSESDAAANQFAVTRISDIGMRMELVKISGDGKSLKFTVYGKGYVTVVPSFSLDEYGISLSAPKGEVVSEDWSMGAGRGIVLRFDTLQNHAVTIEELTKRTSIEACGSICRDTQVWPETLVSPETCEVIDNFSSVPKNTCGCSFAPAKKVFKDGAADLGLACPDSFGNSTSAFQDTCAWLCTDEPSCDYWSLDTGANLCYLLACDSNSTSLLLEPDFEFVSGAPCGPDASATLEDEF